MTTATDTTITAARCDAICAINGMHGQDCPYIVVSESYGVMPNGCETAPYGFSDIRGLVCDCDDCKSMRREFGCHHDSADADIDCYCVQDALFLVSDTEARAGWYLGDSPIGG